MLKKIKNDGSGINNLKTFDLIKIGLAQAVAIVPGISRSGMTYFAARKGGLKKEAAFKFSFLLAIPTILGATFIETLSGYKNLSETVSFGNLATGLIISFIIGIISL